MTNTSKENLPATIPGRIWKILLGLALIAVGSFFVWWLWATFQKAGEMDSWTQVSSEVIASTVIETRYSEISRPTYEPVVQFVYEIDGKTHIGEKIRRVTIKKSSRDAAQAWADLFPVGSKPTAFVNPKSPKISVLKRDSKAALYSIWFPALFVVGGAGMIVTAFRRQPIAGRSSDEVAG